MGCAAFALYFAALSIPGGQYLPDRDAYFHLRIALEILDHGFVSAIPQMAHAIHAERYVDFHFLFHYVLVPFVAIFDQPLLAARVANAAFAALAVCALDLALAGMRVRHRWFWLLGFVLFSPIFTGRLLFGRGVTLLLALLFYFVLCLLRRRFRRAGAIAALAVWTYPGFPVLVGFAGLYWLARTLRRGRFEFEALLWPVAGTLFALLVHPAFPHQFYGYYLEFWLHTAGAPELERIAEWLPPSSEILLLGLALPVAILFATLLVARRHDAAGAALLLSALFFVFAAAISLKPFEYALPFLILYCARQTRGLFAAPASIIAPGGKRVWRALVEGLYVAVAALLLLWSLPEIFRRMELQFRVQNPAHHFAAADWLRANASRDSTVALAWDQFPAFYFRNPDNRYFFGLNPVYSYGVDAERYRISRRLFLPRTYAADAKLSPARDLRRLQARYGVFDRRLNAQTLVALLGPGAAAQTPPDRPAGEYEAVYQNARFIIVRATDEPGQSPPAPGLADTKAR